MQEVYLRKPLFLRGVASDLALDGVAGDIFSLATDNSVQI